MIINSAHLAPSSLFTAATAAMHGVYRRQNTRSDNAARGEMIEVIAVEAPRRTEMVETTLSFAMNPVNNAAAMRQSPNPSGLNIGAMKPAIRERMLRDESSIRFR